MRNDFDLSYGFQKAFYRSVEYHGVPAANILHKCIPKRWRPRKAGRKTKVTPVLVHKFSPGAV
jgi:hypothetical protein